MTDDFDTFGRAGINDMLQRRLQTATSSYEQIINRLWAGNGAAVIASLAAIGSGKTTGICIFTALLLFVFGLLSLAIVALYSLIRLARLIRVLEKATSILDMKARDVLWPSWELGLRFYDFRTIMVFLSAALFLVGSVSGLIAAARVAGL